MARAELLDHYTQLLQLTQEMLELARRSDWDRMIDVERARSAIVDDLTRLDVQIDWSQADLARKSALIQSVALADDEIKALTQAWMGELKEILGSIETEKKLSKTYESP